MPKRKRAGAGSLSERIGFEAEVEGDDGYGGVVVGFAEQFVEPARLEPRVGSEPVIASRLQGLQPYSMTIRSNERTRTITTAWRALNKRTGVVYAIKSAVNIDERNQWIELLVVQGEAS
ncbi:head-tail adaptor protein [Agrobacterium radiobacter]|uniref:head-tail adaptor protein n=1 Tax=Agrobacterium radiobacter TaxID=362 RepID=UPI000761E2AA|nr:MULTISPECIES: head-tail adaptor protein [Agrobacterium tumefaciens complex]KAB0462411.1 head-tail adaptor protein [Agrobacterium tumefaciens]KWT80550.1 head-tail adaptor protein [Agrobacterium radiobacter]NIB09222.1 head-tail adaptor protein [Agrobacterium radiobacter]OOO38973.1 head-tail adaptor protein [Agrobacterium radiobacter]